MPTHIGRCVEQLGHGVLTSAFANRIAQAVQFTRAKIVPLVNEHVGLRDITYESFWVFRDSVSREAVGYQASFESIRGLEKQLTAVIPIGASGHSLMDLGNRLVATRSGWSTSRVR